MIIQRIQSENFLKYTQLDINNLPDSGLIAVSGVNESGKTSIGETLCFALFGRTFTLALEEPRKLIRWGASQCSVSVDFATGPDMTGYSVSRFLDDDGTYGARLERSHDGALLAKGVDNVDRKVRSILGFSYAEFIESFYLAQRELTTPQPHSHTIKVMAGIAPLEKIAQQFKDSIEEEKILQERTETDYKHSRTQLDELGVDDSWFPELLKTRNTVNADIEERTELSSALNQSAQDYSEALPELHKHRRTRKFSKIATAIFFGLTAVFGSLWALLALRPGSSIAINTKAIAGHWLEAIQPVLLPLTTLSALTLVLAAIALIRSKRTLKTLTEKTSHLSEQLAQVNQFAGKSEQRYSDRIFNVFPETATDQPSLLRSVSLESLENHEKKSKDRVLSAEEAIKISQRVNNHLQNNLTINELRQKELEGAIVIETHRLDQASSLRDIRDRLNVKVADHMQRITVREKAVSLLASAAHHQSHRFNQSILELAGDALPKFTQDRYRHLQIDENMDVRVFSNEKRDFMGFEEISSGTQRQIMLALRLAMSEELIYAIDCGKQFIFFDEPFAFFDQQRIRETLSALPQFSEAISQIWLIAQEFPEHIKVDRIIPCSRDIDTLILNG